MSVKIAL